MRVRNGKEQQAFSPTRGRKLQSKAAKRETREPRRFPATQSLGRREKAFSSRRFIPYSRSDSSGMDGPLVKWYHKQLACQSKAITWGNIWLYIISTHMLNDNHSHHSYHYRYNCLYSLSPSISLGHNWKRSRKVPLTADLHSLLPRFCANLHPEVNTEF